MSREPKTLIETNHAVGDHDGRGRLKDYVAGSHRRETVNIEGDRKKHKFPSKTGLCRSA